jgi:hypothetical protein
MQCDGCGGERFLPTEYNLGVLRAPAAECATCHIVMLDEVLARSEGERINIREAIRARLEVSRGPSRFAGAETLPLMLAARPIPDESGNFRVGIQVPMGSGGCKPARRGTAQ